MWHDDVFCPWGRRLVNLMHGGRDYTRRSIYLCLESLLSSRTETGILSGLEPSRNVGFVWMGRRDQMNREEHQVESMPGLVLLFMAGLQKK